MIGHIAYLKANKMIKLEITKEQFERAENLYEFKALNNSITKGESNIFGAIGEVMVHDFFAIKGVDVDHTSTYDYDMIIDGHKIDVKCHATNYEPKEYYNCCVPVMQSWQKCDFYFFTHVTYDFKHCYLDGYKSKSDFFNEARIVKKGEKDKNNFRFKTDNYIVQIKNLNKFQY
jgi:hypothetical protein